jgi:hypothetical protein
MRCAVRRATAGGDLVSSTSPPAAFAAARQAIRRGAINSVTDLVGAITRFIDNWNTAR